MAVSKQAAFKNPKAPVFPRLAQGKTHDEMTVTWTSGYDIGEAYPFVEWGVVTSSGNGNPATRTPAGTLTFNRGSMCGTHGASVTLFTPKISRIRKSRGADDVRDFRLVLSRRAGTDGWVEGSRVHPHGVHEGPVAQQRVRTQIDAEMP